MDTHPSFKDLTNSDQFDVYKAIHQLDQMGIHQSEDIPDQQQRHSSSPNRHNHSHSHSQSPPRTFNQIRDEYFHNLNGESAQATTYDTSAKREVKERSYIELVGSGHKGKKSERDEYMDADFYQSTVNIEKLPVKGKTVVDRLYDFENKKRENLAALQFDKYHSELMSIKDKPEINGYSRAMAEERHHIPIYERSGIELKKKEDHITRMRHVFYERKEEEEALNNTYMPHSFFERNPNEKIRTPDEFINEVYAWEYMRNENIQREEYERDVALLKKLTFKPKINDKTKEICGLNPYFRKKGPIENRLLKKGREIEKAKEKAVRDATPTFKPIVSEKSVKMALKRRMSEKKTKSKNNGYFDFKTGCCKKGEHGRSVTPNPTLKKKYKDSKFNVVQYSPDVDFLLKKLGYDNIKDVPRTPEIQYILDRLNY